LVVDSALRLLSEISLGAIIGFSTAITGMGAAVLVVPIMIYAVGLTPISAVGTGMLYSMLTRIHASFEHIRLETVRKRTAIYIAIGSAPAVLVTSFAITHLGKSSNAYFDLIIELAIIVVMIVTWGMMLINVIRTRKSCKDEDFYHPPEKFPFSRKVYGLIAGAGTGILVGATSIGGGIFLIPILGTFFHLSPSNTVGTSTIISVIMSAVGSIAYLLDGKVDISVALAMFVGSVPGVWIGSRLVVRIPHKMLLYILFLVVTVSILIMLIGTVRSKMP